MYRKRLTLNLKLLKLLEKNTPRIYRRNKESGLIKQNQLYDKRLDEINDLKMEILEAMTEKGNTEEEIEQWTENHRAAVAIYDAQIEGIENRIVALKRERSR